MTQGKLCVLPGRAVDHVEVAMDDREAVRAARGGDDDAFAALVRRYSGGLHRAVARILADDTEAWDVVSGWVWVSECIWDSPIRPRPPVAMKKR